MLQACVHAVRSRWSIVSSQHTGEWISAIMTTRINKASSHLINKARLTPKNTLQKMVGVFLIRQRIIYFGLRFQKRKACYRRFQDPDYHFIPSITRAFLDPVHLYLWYKHGPLLLCSVFGSGMFMKRTSSLSFMMLTHCF